MNLTYEELAVLNKIISNALLNGELEFNDITKSIHTKVTNEICRLSENSNQSSIGRKEVRG